jgi:hypothetical protein
MAGADKYWGRGRVFRLSWGDLGQIIDRSALGAKTAFLPLNTALDAKTTPLPINTTAPTHQYRIRCENRALTH